MLALPYVCVPVLVTFGAAAVDELCSRFARVARRDTRDRHVPRARRRDACPPDYPAAVWPLWYSALAFVHARDFGLYLLAGLAVAWIIGAPFSAR